MRLSSIQLRVGFLMLFLWSGNFFLEAQSDDPLTAPVPDFVSHSQDPSRALVVKLLFQNTDPPTVELQSVEWSQSRARTNIANPPHYEVLLYNDLSELIDRFDIWDPLWTFSENEDGSESLQIESQATTSVIFPLSGNLSEMHLYDVETSELLINVDLGPAITDFCNTNPDHPECIPSDLDIDGNERADALTDGILVLRYLFEFVGSSLVTGALAEDCTRCEADDVQEYLGRLQLVLDVDNNGETDALSDGTLTLRYLFGFKDESLVTGAVADDCTRCSANEIESYLETIVPR